MAGRTDYQGALRDWCNPATEDVMTFEQFQATKRWSDDLVHEPNVDLGFDEVAPGFVYEGGLHIFAHEGGASPQFFELVIGNERTFSEHLVDLEAQLYLWGVDERVIGE
jgi:hypothetical protein